METALKQRLLGAAVLIALAVIFLPMFFSGAAPEPATENISLEIPAPPEGDLQTRVYDLSPDATASTKAKPTAGTVLPVLDLDGPAAESPETGAETGTGPGADAETAPAVAAPEENAQAEDAAPGTAAEVHFVVSLGVYADQDNALSQLELAKAQGYPVYAEQMTVDGKRATGVRVGPFPNRVEAESARLKLAATLSGVKPSLVALVDHRANDAPATAVAADEAGNWAVQLAAYRQRTDALKLRDRAREAGFEAFIDEVDSADGHWWRVRVGPRTQREDVEALQATIKQRLDIDGIVVTHP